MASSGALPPPDGVSPNFDNPEDVLQTVNYATQAVTIVVVSPFIAIRYYSKARVLGGKLQLDDYAAYAAYILLIGYCIIACCASAYGGGLNQWEVSKDVIQSFSKSTYAATIFYAPMALATKLALLIIIIRVFGSVHVKTMKGLYIFVGALVLYYVSGIFLKIFVCWPISAYWTGDNSRCMDQAAVIISDATISVISDLVILVLPMPLTWSLSLPRKQRLRVTGLLCAGGVATAFGVYRFVMILNDHHSKNQTIVFIKVILSGNAEIGIGLICACLPAVSSMRSRRGRSSSYFRQSSHSEPTASPNGHITVRRSAQVTSSRESSTCNSHTIATDEFELTPKLNADVKRSQDHTKMSESMC